MACGNSGGDDDSGVDSSIPDAAQDAHHDATTADSGNKDATGTDASDASADDGSTDAIDDTVTDALDDGALDAGDDGSLDASDGGSSIDSGPPTDGGKKSCLGVFCIMGDSCCNNMKSKNYGKCEPTACLACCM